MGLSNYCRSSFSKLAPPAVAGDALIPVTRIGSFVNVWLSDMILSSNINSDCFDCYFLSAGFVPKELFRFNLIRR